MLQNRILRERVAGQSAMSAVVQAQATARPLRPVERMFGVNPLTHESRTSYRGALGELFVGDLLDNLGPTWDVLHDIPLGDAVLDHLVIGRAGVFTIRTASFGREDVVVDGDSLLVDGSSHDDILGARAEATRVAAVLSEASGRVVEVRALLVIVAPRRLTIRAAAVGIGIIVSTELDGLLERAPHTLTGEEVAQLSDVADLVTTWPTATGSELDTQKLNRDFGVIRSEVRDALVRRVFWAAASTAVVYVTVCSIIATFVSIVVAR